MTTTETSVQTRVPRPGALPYLSIRGARDAIEFYRAVFDAEVIGDPYIMGDGRVGHAELAMGGGTIYLADESPDIGFLAPSGGASAVGLIIAVDDTDVSLQRIREAGGTVLREPADNYGARGATALDPFGHRWMLSGPITTPAPTREAIQPGDLGYVSWWTPDAGRAATFYGRVLGWSFTSDEGPRRHTHDTSISTGIDGGHDTSGLFCCYAVRDVDAVVEVVRAAGGTADDPTDEVFGRSAMCTDPQGLRFAVYEAAPGTTRPAVNGERAGDLEYVTYQMPSSSAFREFYGALFGWTFTPGRIEDGWGPVDVAPMSGINGGEDRPLVVPMWRVEDVPAAVEIVVAAGGRIIDPPSRQPYGMSAQCEDDQGGRFYLGEG